jgi:hypothetical protein
MDSTWFRVFEILCGGRALTAGGEAWSDALATLPHELWLAVLVNCTPNGVLQYAATCKRARISCKAERFEICGMPRVHSCCFNSLFFHHHACHRVVRCVARHFNTGLFRAIAADNHFLTSRLKTASSRGCLAVIVSTPHRDVARCFATRFKVRVGGTPSNALVYTYPESSPHATKLDFTIRGNTVTVHLVGPAVWTP